MSIGALAFHATMFCSCADQRLHKLLMKDTDPAQVVESGERDRVELGDGDPFREQGEIHKAS
jgi:hypothetical protein